MKVCMAELKPTHLGESTKLPSFMRRLIDPSIHP
jgi:hypothetical protein